MSGKASLYFHIPFCSRKCPYCHFYVLPNKESYHTLLKDALLLEWKKIAPLLENKEIVSIYFGGGTPSLFGPKNIHDILSWVQNKSSDCEITLEANPDHLPLSLLQEFKEAGINRLSIGVQSLDDASLQIIGREHNAKAAISAIENSYQAGIRNISIDLMYDLPSQTIASWERTLFQLEKLPITHLSLYNLTLEPHTVFFKNKKALTPLLPTPETSLAMLQKAVDSLESIGLKRYEISAFAKECFSSKHNTGYWKARPFLGLGPSAFSYWDKKRFRNIANLSLYAKALQEGSSPIDFEECLPYPKNLAELLAVQIRMVEGVNIENFQKDHGELSQEIHQAVLNLQKKGHLGNEGNILKLTAEGMLFYDSVAEEIIFD